MHDFTLAGGSRRTCRTHPDRHKENMETPHSQAPGIEPTTRIWTHFVNLNFKSPETHPVSLNYTFKTINLSKTDK